MVVQPNSIVRVIVYGVPCNGAVDWENAMLEKLKNVQAMTLTKQKMKTRWMKPLYRSKLTKCVLLFIGS